MDPDRIDVDRLFSVPLEDFVAERKQLAKELRAAGDRDAAAEVAKWPKPTPPAWALNLIAREDPDALASWLDAAEELREVSASPGTGLREAMAAHRDATRDLLAVVRDRAQPGGKPLSPPMLERVRELLQAATVDAALAEALRAGRVVEGGEAPALFGGDDDGDAAPAPRAPVPAPPKREPREERAARKAEEERAADKARAAKERERAERIAQLERHIEESEERLAGLREEAEERSAAASEAESKLEDARRTLNRAESEAAAAHDAAEDASEAVATEERELRQLGRQLRSASS
jgi:hypothetical protein